jgi:glycosyltransferase involved in cell wall biosynthesis
MERSTPTEPRATVVVTCFNQEQWIEQALDSVAVQTEQNLQLIVTDDGSADGSRARIEQWLSRHDLPGELVASDHNIGLPAMLNRAMPSFRGRYVVVLNGDDWMDPSRVASQAAALDGASGRVGLVYSDLRVVDAGGAPTGEIFPAPSVERREGRVLLHIISQPMIGMPSVMFRRSVLDVIGGWDESLVADDFDFLLRVAAANFEFIYLPAVLTNYRWYGDSMTGSRRGVLAEGQILALYKLLGRDAETNRAILNRVQEIAVVLHASAHDPHTTRRYLWFVMRRQPSRRVARVLAESYLHLRPGALTGASLRQALHR